MLSLQLLIFLHFSSLTRHYRVQIVTMTTSVTRTLRHRESARLTLARLFDTPHNDRYARHHIAMMSVPTDRVYTQSSTP